MAQKSSKARTTKTRGTAARPMNPEGAEPKRVAPKVSKDTTGKPRSSVTKDTRPQGSWSDKAREAGSRGEPKLKPGKATAAADIKKGDLRSSFAKGPKAASRLGSVLRTAGKVAGPVGAAIGFIVDASPAGAGSDKPSGKLFSPSANRSAGKGNPKTTNPYKKPTPKITAGLTRNAFDTGRATTPAVKPKKAAVAPPKPTARPSMKKGSSTPPAYTPEKAQKRGNVTSGFSGNWVNAAPTEMQKRGGDRIDRGGGLFGKLRKK